MDNETLRRIEKIETDMRYEMISNSRLAWELVVQRMALYLYHKATQSNGVMPPWTEQLQKDVPEMSSNAHRAALEYLQKAGIASYMRTDFIKGMKEG